MLENIHGALLQNPDQQWPVQVFVLKTDSNELYYSGAATGRERGKSLPPNTILANFPICVEPQSSFFQVVGGVLNVVLFFLDRSNNVCVA